MKRLLASSIAAVALLTACGVAEDTTAATVGDREISVAAVDSLAKSEFIAGQAQATGAELVSSGSGVTGSTKQRQALTYLVQRAAFEEELAARGDRVTSADREEAERQITAYEAKSGELGDERKVLLEWLASNVAIVRVLDIPAPDVPEVPEPDPAEYASPDKIAAFFEQYRDQFGQIACVDGFAVPSSKQAAAQAAVDGGTTVAQVLADPSFQAQGFSEDGAEACLPTGQISPDLATLAVDTPLGQWATTTIAQGTDSLTVFLRPNSRTAPTIDNPTVVDVITQALGQQAQQVAQQQQAAASAAQQEASDESDKQIAEIVAAADVEIDPRYGSFDPTAPGLISAPPSPRASGPATTTLPVLQGS